MPVTFPWNAFTARTSGISAESVAAGANFLGAEIDFSSIKDTDAAISIAFECGSAPTANKTLELYILYAPDGTNYEDGGTSVDPTGVPAGIVAARAVTTAQRGPTIVAKILPFKAKLLIKSELDQTAAVTVSILTGIMASA